MKITIEYTPNDTAGQYIGWKVDYEDKYADQLNYDEMLGLVAAITMPPVKERGCLEWLRTEAQHQVWKDYIFSPSSAEPEL